MPTFGEFNTGSQSVGFGTAWAQLVRPWGGAGGPQSPHQLVNKRGNWPKAYTHINKLIVDSSTTQNLVYAMRPRNYSVILSAAAINQAVINLTDDPGILSTNYKYALPPGALGVQGNTADRGIAAGDYAAYMLADGTWILDTVASVSGLAITMTTSIPNVTGGGVLAGTIFYLFGIFSDKNPATGAAHDKFLPPVSARANLLGDGSAGSISSYHAQDPMVLYCPNITATTSLVTAAGYYDGNK